MIQGLILSLSSGCSAPEEKVKQESSAGLANVPLVFIHGIKGAELRNSTDDLMWIDLWTGLGLKSPDLALPLRWDPLDLDELAFRHHKGVRESAEFRATENTVQAKDNIKAVGLLESIPVIPFLYRIPIYVNWLAAVRKSDRPFYPFYYDWRRDNLESTERFKTFLLKVFAREKRPVQVVAHSMGGLITLPVLNESPEIFHSVVFAGVPFVGGIGFLPDLAEIHPTGLNSRVLSPEVLGTFPSVYSFFPLAKEGFVIDESNRPVEVDFFSPSEWKKYGWGLFHSSNDSEIKTRFITTALDHARKFRNRLVAAPVHYPPITVVSGTQLPTYISVRRLRSQSLYRWDFGQPKKCAGDGSVCVVNSKPPKGVPYRSILTEHSHVYLLDDPNVVQQIME